MQPNQDPEARPRSIEELLDHEEARALADLGDDLTRAGEDLATATQIRGRIRAHPLLATALAFAGGWIGAPLILRAVQRLSSAASGSGGLASLRPNLLRDLAQATLRQTRQRG